MRWQDKFIFPWSPVSKQSTRVKTTTLRVILSLWPSVASQSGHQSVPPWGHSGSRGCPDTSTGGQPRPSVTTGQQSHRSCHAGCTCFQGAGVSGRCPSVTGGGGLLTLPTSEHLPLCCSSAEAFPSSMGRKCDYRGFHFFFFNRFPGFFGEQNSC